MNYFLTFLTFLSCFRSSTYLKSSGQKRRLFVVVHWSMHRVHLGKAILFESLAEGVLFCMLP